MGKLTDVAIRAWIKVGERFEGRTDGDGLVLTWRPDRTAPHWRVRHRFAGRSRVMNLAATPTCRWPRPASRPRNCAPRSPSATARAVEWLLKLKELACNAEYVLPARTLQSRRVPPV